MIFFIHKLILLVPTYLYVYLSNGLVLKGSNLLMLAFLVRAPTSCTYFFSLANIEAKVGQGFDSKLTDVNSNSWF